jgi:hypothetical protein
MNKTKNNTNLPFSLLVFAAIYFVTGFGSVIQFFISGNYEFLVGILSCALGYGVFSKKPWGLFLFKVFVILEVIAIIPIIILYLISNESSATILLFGVAKEVNANLVVVLTLCIILFQAITVYSERTKHYFKNSNVTGMYP